MNDKNGTDFPGEEGESPGFRDYPPVTQGDGPQGTGDGQLDFSFSTSVVRDFQEGYKHKHSINSPDNRQHVHVPTCSDGELSFCRELSGKIHIPKAQG